MRHISDAEPASTAATQQPAENVSEHLADLSFAPRLLVWAARVWWQDAATARTSPSGPAHPTHPAHPAHMIGQAFALARCRDAAPAFDELMLMARHGACRHLDIASHTSRLGRDEQALLGVVAAFQNDAVIGGERALERWLPPATARLAADAALKLAREMGRAQLYVERRCPYA